MAPKNNNKKGKKPQKMGKPSNPKRAVDEEPEDAELQTDISKFINQIGLAESGNSEESTKSQQSSKKPVNKKDRTENSAELGKNTKQPLGKKKHERKDQKSNTAAAPQKQLKTKGKNGNNAAKEDRTQQKEGNFSKIGRSEQSLKTSKQSNGAEKTPGHKASGGKNHQRFATSDNENDSEDIEEEMTQPKGRKSGKVLAAGGQGTFEFAKELADGEPWFSVPLATVTASKVSSKRGRIRQRAHMEKEGATDPQEKQKVAQKDLAEKLFEEEIEKYEQHVKRTMNSDGRMLQKMISSGTLSDKVAGLTLMIQQSPLHSMKQLQALTSMAWKKGRRESQSALEALLDLYLNNLLPDRKLKFIVDQPLIADPNTITKRHLILWQFEHLLKQQFAQFVAIVERGMADTLDHFKRLCLTMAYELLSAKPEQERAFLLLLVNKLGDPDRKISSKAVFLIEQLVNKHPAMKPVVVKEIEQLLLRPNLTARAEYCAVICLNQFYLSENDEQLAQHLIHLYFKLFEKSIASNSANHDKKSKGSSHSAEEMAANSRLLAGLLTGVNRAFPFAGTTGDDFEEKTHTLFRIVHQAPFNTAIQAMMLLFQVMSATHSISDRFYRALYSMLFDSKLTTCSKHTMFFNLLFRALKNDSHEERVAAFIKRLLQVSLRMQPPFAAAALFLTSELLKGKPKIRMSLICGQHGGNDANDLTEQVKDSPMDDGSMVETPAVTAKSAEDSKDSQKNASHSTEANSTHYDPLKREPLYANADKTCLWEIREFCRHYHPSVQEFAKALLREPKHAIEYGGDPLTDFTMIAFLDRFSFRNPKAKDAPVRGMARKVSKLAMAQARLEEPEQYFQQFFKTKQDQMEMRGIKSKKKKADAEDGELDILEDMSDASVRASDNEDDEFGKEDSDYEAYAHELAEGLMENFDDEDPDTQGWSDSDNGEEDDTNELTKKSVKPTKGSKEPTEEDSESFDDGDMDGLYDEEDSDDGEGLAELMASGKKGKRRQEMDDEDLMFDDDDSDDDDEHGDGFDEDDDDGAFGAFGAEGDDDDDFGDDESEEEEAAVSKNGAGKAAPKVGGKKSVFADASEFEDILASAGKEDADSRQLQWEERAARGSGKRKPKALSNNKKGASKRQRR